MLNLNKTYFVLFCFLVLSLLFSPQMIPFIDEFTLLAMVFLAVLDMLYNKAWRNYRVFFSATGVLLFYYIFTLLFRDYNIFKAVTMDFITHMKPVIAFGITYALAPRFTPQQRTVIKWMCLIICAIGYVSYFTPYFKSIIFHVYYLGNIFLASAVILLSSLDKDDWIVIKKYVVLILLILAVGLVNSRAKYYGSAVVLLFMLVAYKPKIIASMSIRSLATTALLIAGVLFVAWNKIQFYFISGNNIDNSVDEDIMMTFARPALYYFSILILCDYPVFGSGMASFASYSASNDYNYSALYYEYGVNHIWGLSEEFGAFLADTFYPEFAQFGLVGIALFVYAIYWLYQRLRIAHRKLGTIPFATGVCILAILGIDGVASTGWVNSLGEMLFAVLGMILAQVRDIKGAEAKKCIKTPLKGRSSIWQLDYELKKI